MQNKNPLAPPEITLLIARAGRNLSREFSNPLEQLIGPLEKLLEEESDLQKKEQLHVALKNAYRFHSLVQVLNEIAQVESGEPSFVFHQSDIVKFTKSIVDSFGAVAKQRKISLRFHSSLKELHCFFDYNKLRRIIYTLVANAIRYSDKELSEITISVQPVKGSNQVCFNVTDNGVGIAADKIPFLANPFYEDPLHLQLYQSTSLALYLVKRLLEILGGSLNFHSKKGSGTHAEIIFPVFPDAASIPFQSFSIDKNILPELVQLSEYIREVDTYEIIDHQPDLNKHLPLLLVYQEEKKVDNNMLPMLRQNFRVLFAAKSSKAMQLAQEHQPDLVLLLANWDDSLKATVNFLKQTTLSKHIPLFWRGASITEGQYRQAVACCVDGISDAKEDHSLLLAKLQQVLTNRRLAYDHAARKSIHALSKPAQEPSMEDGFLQRLHFIIEKNLHDTSPDLTAYCALMNYSRAQLHRKIKTITGLSTSNYIRKYKLKLALTDLQNGSHNVSEISYKYGFGSLAYFSRVFKASFGLSPSSVRGNHQLKQAAAQ